MADNLKTVEDFIIQKITNAGGPGTVLATDNKTIFVDTLKKAGKYSGLYFVARKQPANYQSGTLSWESNALNAAGEFEIVLSKLTADLDDVGVVLKAIGGNTLILYKDYTGKSGIYTFVSYEEDTIGADAVYRLTLKSATATNPSYTLQDAEALICGLTIIPNTNGGRPYGQLNWWKAEGNADNLIIEAGDTVQGQLQGGIFLTRGTFVAGDPTLIASYDEYSDYYDPNN